MNAKRNFIFIKFFVIKMSYLNKTEWKLIVRCIKENISTVLFRTAMN